MLQHKSQSATLSKKWRTGFLSKVQAIHPTRIAAKEAKSTATPTVDGKQ
jgi:hypothetical protein